jgi:surface antigen
MATHGISTVIAAIIHGIGKAIIFFGRIIAFPFVTIGHGVGHLFGAVSRPINSQVASVIQPRQNAEMPVITPAQAQQVSLIQADTLAVTPIKPAGSGGACDSGAGNGGYPMNWCDARMDTIQTVSYSSDRINRQCTSYAFWYFTTVEGHSDFHVTGNANRWARTSNYPTHATPAVGAIAVQTGGYYGHVAIVQALPGAIYEGKTVPNGYVLVSEMNYDWQGHFRYSYSPLAKFSAYIYP